MNDNLNIGALLAEQVERLFAAEVTRATLVAAESGQLAHALWQQLEEMGVPSALVAEDAGGAGLLWSDLEGVLSCAGFHAAPLPLGETLAARQALAEVGLTLPGGPLALTDSPLVMAADGALSGTLVVPWGGQCEHLVAVAEGPQGPSLCLLAAAAGTPHPGGTSRIPALALCLDGMQPLASAPAPARAEFGLRAELAAVRAAQIGGALERLLALCVEYGNTRTQFGRPIGKFQAVQQMIAALAEQAAAARVAGQLACRSLASANPGFGVAAAKVQAGKSAAAGAAIAHQVFGAMGITDEHELHFHTRRLWQWRDEGGSEHWWAEHLGRRVIAAGGAGLWPTLVGG